MEPQTISAGPYTLRPFRRADVEWVYQVSTDPETRHWVHLPIPYRMEHAEYFVDQIATAGWRRGRRAEFLVEDSVTGEPLGRVGLGLAPEDAATVGFWVDPRARGRGVATASVRTVCDWGFRTLGLGLIEWRAEVGNAASRRVAEKAGFLVEGVLRSRLVHRGERVDAWVGSLLPTDPH
ncbi:GNAT family N-acetyltransferase [Catenuloplanes atrovinosus]|uniref:RimJ/RimL family protein N-acetyltransferase n=1 Tax=Catenuloplanes atrovinosus TaxID=137266 RepID=A0AAE3YHV7_9ACTN|nr:GNAT family N-acetyltransferase [Catenuloplanes atrovinosus]MDR7273710.1 RimJ/RimL family protein N-acetyltransferase [Catenuloplanes atrovinosus]